MLERMSIVLEILCWISVVVVIFLCGYVCCALNGISSISSSNAIEDSKAFAGYSPVGVYTIFDRTNGVMYAVSETGDIELMVDEEGKPKMIPE